jgi:regulator of protease activity HflC (stomatin/prohibitin superfamily)
MAAPKISAKEILSQLTISAKKIEGIFDVKKKTQYLYQTLSFGFVSVLLLVVVLVADAFYVNQESQRALETRYGVFVKLSGPGLHFKLPFIEQYTQYPIDIQELSFGDVRTASSDNYELNGQVVLHYQIPDDENIIKNIHRNAPNYKKILEDIMKSAFKNELGTVRMATVPEKRRNIESKVKEIIRQEAERLLKIHILDFRVPFYEWSQVFLRTIQRNEENLARIEATYWAEQQKKNNAEKEAFDAAQKRKRAQEEAELLRIQAQAQAEALKIDAQAQAETQVLKLEKQAEVLQVQVSELEKQTEILQVQVGELEKQAKALQIQAKTLEKNPDLIDLERIKRWDGKLPPGSFIIKGIVPNKTRK